LRDWLRLRIAAARPALERPGSAERAGAAGRPGGGRPLVGALVLAAALASLPAGAELYVWIDADGGTHVTDDPHAIPPDAAPLPGSGGDVGGLWGGRIRGPTPRAPSRARTEEEARIARLVRGALDDLSHGESARAAVALESVLRLDPGQPDAHWYLAILDRQRGRFDSAQRHLEAFLSNAGDGYDDWRASAERRLRNLKDERRLEDEQAASGPLRLIAAESPHFRIHYDAQLGQASPDYARTALRYLEEAYRAVGARLGVEPREPTGVVFYGKAAYLAVSAHRFSFPTVGFFDGRIHVASAAHPAGELRALLFHEFTHAVFAERTGGDRPYWLNEGLAERIERASRGENGLARSERAALARDAGTGAWIPLARLGPGFDGLDEAAARTAYLESTAAAGWIETHAGAAGIGALLDAVASGQDVDAALRRVVGVDTAGLDAALQRGLRAEFE
jgi:tetratricopeptide (TPR) repeat protein